MWCLRARRQGATTAYLLPELSALYTESIVLSTESPFATFSLHTFLSTRIGTAGFSFRSVFSSENMSYYDNQQWPAVGSQPSWDQQTPPARSGTLPLMTDIGLTGPLIGVPQVPALPFRAKIQLPLEHN